MLRTCLVRRYAGQYLNPYVGPYLGRPTWGRVAHLCLIFVLWAMLTGCATYGGHRVEDGEGMRQKTWADFQENRPAPEYIYSQSPAVTRLCADITDVYIVTIETVDRAAARAENCEVACRLEAVRCEYGEKAYLDALNNLTDEERQSFRIYERNEVHELHVVDHLWHKTSDFTWHMTDLMYELNCTAYEYGWLEGLLSGIEAVSTLSRMDAQIEYTIEALAWLREYQKLLERAQNYQGR